MELTVILNMVRAMVLLFLLTRPAYLSQTAKPPPKNDGRG